MIRERALGVRKRVNPNEIIGLREYDTLDELIRVKTEVLDEDHVLTRELNEVLKKEFVSAELVSVLKSVRITQAELTDLKEIAALLHNIPEKLYYFLWSLKNSDVMPIEGVITSFQLQKTVFYLCKFLLVLEVFLKRAPKSIPVYENLGFVYLDLAGLANYTRLGLMLNGRLYRSAVLLRKAIACFQVALKLEAHHGKELDTYHKKTLRLLDSGFDFRTSRVNLYLNPWYLLYISSALQQLNDQEGAAAYLQKARAILNSLSNHLNPRVKAQNDLLESVYGIMKDGESVKFDFEEGELTLLERKIKHVQMEKRNGHQRNGYNPLVAEALAEQYRAQYNLQTKRIPDATQAGFLRSIFTLYQNVSSPAERDKLIYRLNIPPVKIKGQPPSLKLRLAQPKRLKLTPKPQKSTG